MVMIMLDVILGFFNYRGTLFTEVEQQLNRTIIFSVYAVLSFFMINNIDNARWFGTDRLKIPNAMKHSAFVLLAILGVLTAALSFSTLILSVLETIFDSIAVLLRSLAEFLTGMLRSDAPFQDTPADMPFLPEPDEYTEPSGTPRAMMVTGYIMLTVTAAVAGVLVLIGLFFILRALVRFILTNREDDEIQQAVFTEVIEKITPGRDKRAAKRRGRRQRYSSLQTERERILFIYREYVRRAKNNGLTGDHPGDTANEILNEIIENAGGRNFPLPDGLGIAYNAARYSDDYDENTGSGTISSSELKQRLI